MMKSAQYFLLLCLLSRSTASSSTTTDEKPSNLRGHGRQTSATTRIVGGTEIPLNKYPYYVQWAHGCSGVLFHDDLILTAAHCNAADPYAIKRYPLYVGGDGTTHSGTSMYATEAYPHPRYNPQVSHLYDFAVLKLPQKIENVSFVDINANPNYPSNGQPLIVMGHGLMDENDERNDAPEVFRQVTIPFIENCAPYFGQVDPKVQFCAGDMPNGGKDACQGDSGSGIFDSNGLLVGVVSWGIGCARPNRPGVYARVSTIARWLEHLKCQASQYPPEHCTTLSVELTVDDYPEELGFSLLDVDEPHQPEAVVLPPGSLEATAGETLQYTFSVPKGRDYVLQVQDKNKDGFCCTYGEGSVVVQDRTILYDKFNADFGEGVEFGSIFLPQVGGPATQLLAIAPTPPVTEASSAAKTSAETFAIQFVIQYGESISKVGDDGVSWKFSHQSTITSDPDEEGTTLPRTTNRVVVSWKQDSPDDKDAVTTTTTTILHEDLPSNPNRILDDYNRQVVQFDDLEAGTYELSITDTLTAITPGWIQVRVFALDERGHPIGLLHQSQGGEAIVKQTFQIGEIVP